MNSISNSFTLTLILCLMFIKCGSAIFCYDCNSAFDPRCGKEFDSFSLGVVNCSLRDSPEHLQPMEAKFCRSIKMEIYGKTRVVRQCGYLTDVEVSNHTCRRVVGSGDLFVTYCACDTDLCNAASTIRYRQVALFLISLILMWSIL